VRPRRDVEVLGDRERGEHAPPAGRLDDAERGDPVRRPVGDVDAVELDRTRRHREQPADGVQHRRLPGAVGAEQGEVPPRATSKLTSSTITRPSMATSRSRTRRAGIAPSPALPPSGP
jgi:hypothetical protein